MKYSVLPSLSRVICRSCRHVPVVADQLAGQARSIVRSLGVQAAGVPATKERAMVRPTQRVERRILGPLAPLLAAGMGMHLASLIAILVVSSSPRLMPLVQHRDR
ncbi:uncharacterized protein BDW70DRAFT_54054 [Aspergillus foveolatus]|uniref:uncharacterized protein n=1 Tax=Aspergillus foveolatus TaxID=210207 RepID=UPI003CCD1D0F